jgi:putative transposase
MGLMAVYAKPRLSLNPLYHRRFPYLLKGVATVRPNQVWSTDITYIRLRGGFVYLAAVLDWYNRYVLAWELSISLEADFCVTVLERALAAQRPEIFNTDQRGAVHQHDLPGATAGGPSAAEHGRSRATRA